MDTVLSLPPNTDEHVYKMVQIWMAMMEENKQDTELHKLCLSACEIAINNKLIIWSSFAQKYMQNDTESFW